MADRYMVLRPGTSEIWDGDYVIDMNSDGYWQKGISRSYTAISTGQYSGNSSIVVAGATDVHTNAVVQDNRTGLMWSKAGSASVGSSADGDLFWDDHVDVIQHDGGGTTFTRGDLITQLNTNETAMIRYENDAMDAMGIVNASTSPFSTAAANTITGVANGGPAVISPYHSSSKEDIWEYVHQANKSSVALGGHTDWRIPNTFELASIMWFSSASNLAKPSTVYWDDLTGYYWTASKKSKADMYANRVSFDSGASQYSTASQTHYPKSARVLLVRGPTTVSTASGNYPCSLLKTGCDEPAVGTYPDDGYYQLGQARSYSVLSAGNYAGTSTLSTTEGSKLEIANACVDDLNTNLMWTKSVCIGTTETTVGLSPYYDPDGIRIDAINIIRSINEQQVGGHADWRLPNVFEAESVLLLSPAHKPSTDYFDETTANWHTCTVRPDSTAYVFRMTISNNWGGGMTRINSTAHSYVRAVRGGNTDADL